MDSFIAAALSSRIMAPLRHLTSPAPRRSSGLVPRPGSALLGALLGGLLALGCGSSDGSSAGDEGPGASGGRRGTGGPDGDGGRSGADGGGSSSGGSGGARPGGGDSSAADIARRLGREPNFLIGMGNDLPESYDWSEAGVHTLPATLDLHYIYLVGLKGEGGWTDWNEGGWFPYIIGEVDVEHGVTPMSTVYGMAAWGENRLDVLTEPDFMGPYWDAAKLLFQRLGEDLGAPALVHVEPDFWGFAQQATGGDPSKQAALLHEECSDLPGDVSGVGRCWVKLARTYAPQVVIGLHASLWADPDPVAVGEFLNACGGAESDIVVIDMLDRDAGCFEAGELPECQRGGKFYWDETNQTSPNFHEHLDWVGRLFDEMKKPVLWWQLPFGVPSDTPGGEPGRYRDNRVKYLFENVQEFVDVGGLGACFGTGAAGQTYITTDGGQFEDAVVRYYANPVPLP